MWIALVPADGLKMNPSKIFGCRPSYLCPKLKYTDKLVAEPKAWFGHFLPQLSRMSFPGKQIHSS